MFFFVFSGLEVCGFFVNVQACQGIEVNGGCFVCIRARA